MRKIQIALSSDLCIRLTWNLTGSCGQQQTSWVVVVLYGCKTIPRWRTAAILKIDMSPYLSEKSSDFDEILYTAAILKWMNVTWSKMKKLYWTDSEFDRTYLLCCTSDCCFYAHDTCLTAISGCLIFCKATVTEIYSTSVTFNNYRTVRWRLQHNTSIFIRVTSCGADGRVDCTAGARSTLVGILRAID